MRYSPPLDGELNLAFSCGKDSIACSHFLRFKCRKKITLIHVNNKLPGDDWIELRAKSYADKFGFEFHAITSVSNSDKETDCREARIAAFKQYKSVVVCHHLGDVVENYLFNVFSGVPHYTPIRQVSQYGETDIIRPFLRVHPEEIQSYLDLNKLNNWIVQDPLSKNSTRGFFRDELLPVIKKKYNLFGVCKKLIK